MKKNWIRFKKHKPAVVGLIVISIYVFFALFGPYVAPHDPVQINISNRLESPSINYLFGTDAFGRDILSRVIYGTRISMTIGIFSVILGAVFGGTMGLIAAFFKKLDGVIMYFMDVLLAFPSILLAIGIIAILGPGFRNVIIAIGIRQIPSYARMVRSTVISIRDEDYVIAARALGANNYSIITKYIIPNSIAPILVYSTLQIGWCILLASFMSFVGLGVKAPTPEWGLMVSEGRNYLRFAPYVSTIPGFVIFGLLMSLNLVGDALRDTFDPKLIRD